MDSYIIEFTVVWELEDYIVKDEKLLKAEDIDWKRFVKFRVIEDTVNN